MKVAKTGKIDKVRKLLKEGCPVDALDSWFGLTPLHFAVRNARVDRSASCSLKMRSSTQPSTQGIIPLDWFSEYLDPNQCKALLRFAVGDKETHVVQEKKLQ